MSFNPLAKRLIFSLCALCCLLALPGCSEDGSAPAAEAPATAPAAEIPARTLELPGDRPAVGGEPQRLTWKVPSGWEVQQPANNMRLAQYRVSGSGGDGECVVFYFGPGQGGDPMANAERWAGQFSQPDGSDPLAAMQVSQLESAATESYLVEVGGTYSGGMSGAGPLENARLLGGIALGPDAPWFFKLTGPDATVRENKAAFVAMMESVGRDG